MSNINSVIEIIGNRVILRDPRPEDVDARLRWVTCEVAWQEWDAPWEGRSLALPGREDEARCAILESMSKPLPTPRNQLWIEHKGGPLLGWVNHYHYDKKERTTWVGINICESSFWGKGYGTEALRLWITFLFTNLNLHSIKLGTWSGNLRMIWCAEKCGFTLIDRTPHCREVRGEWHDGLEFGLTRGDWETGGIK